VQTFHFALTRRDTGRLVGHALLCPDARFATVLWAGADRLDRRHATPHMWKQVIGDLEIGWEKWVVAGDCSTARFLLDPDARAVVALQLISQPPIDGTTPGEIAAALDRYLAAQLLAVPAT
jgi:hypothetical protein